MPSITHFDTILIPNQSIYNYDTVISNSIGLSPFHTLEFTIHRKATINCDTGATRKVQLIEKTRPAF